MYITHQRLNRLCKLLRHVAHAPVDATPAHLGPPAGLMSSDNGDSPAQCATGVGERTFTLQPGRSVTMFISCSMAISLAVSRLWLQSPNSLAKRSSTSIGTGMAPKPGTRSGRLPVLSKCTPEFPCFPRWVSLEIARAVLFGTGLVKWMASEVLGNCTDFAVCGAWKASTIHRRWEHIINLILIFF